MSASPLSWLLGLFGDTEPQLIETSPVEHTASSTSLYHTQYLESYSISCTGDEFMFCQDHNFQIIKENDTWTKTVFNFNLDNNLYQEPSKTDELTGEITAGKEVVVKDSYTLYQDYKFPVVISPTLVKDSKNKEKTFEKGDKLVFSFELSPSTTYAKLGDNSVTIIQQSTLSSYSNYDNLSFRSAEVNYTENNMTLDTGRVLYLNFNIPHGGNNITRDSSGNGNDGTVIKANYTQGYVGNAYNISNASQGYISTTSTSIGNLTNQNFSICYWAYDYGISNSYTYPLSTSTSINSCCISFSMASAYINATIRRFDVAILNESGSSQNLLYRPNYSINEWNFFCAVKNSLNLSLSINGLSLDGDTLSSSKFRSTKQIVIGKSTSDSTKTYNGIIDSVNVWNRSLSSAEIQALYLNQSNFYLPAKLGFPVNLQQDNTKNRLNVTMDILTLGDSNITLSLKAINMSVNLSGCVAHYNGEDGKAQDWCGDNDGIMYGNAFINDTRGRNGSKGFGFDGCNVTICGSQKIQLPNSPSLNITNESMFSISVWVNVKGSNTANQNYEAIVSRYATNNNRYFGLYYRGLNNYFNFVQYPNASTSGSAFIINTSYVEKNRWYHLAVVANSTNVTLYLNGDMADVGKRFFGIYNPAYTTPLLIGAVWDSTTTPDQVFNGSIDDVLIFNRSLSSTEILNLYNNQSSNKNAPYYMNQSVKISNGTTVLQITTESDLALLEYQLNPGQYGFFSPNIKGDILTESWTENETVYPLVTLNNPEASYMNDTRAFTYFNCIAEDSDGIMNISLYLTNSSNQSFSLNMSNATILSQSSFLCYQETANESNDCGGLSTGYYETYNESWGSNYNISSMYDGNWTTFGQSAFSSVRFNVTYKFNNSLNEFKLDLLYGNSSFTNETNISFSSDCIQNGEIRIKSELSWTVNRIDIYCYNFTSSATSLITQINNLKTPRLYEERAIYNFSNISYPSMSQNTFNVTYNLSIGNYTWNCQACDILGNCEFGTNRTVEIREPSIPCTPSWSNTSWSSWLNLTACQTNDTTQKIQNLTQYDANSCAGSSNTTFYNYGSDSCNYCSYSVTNTTWSAWSNITSCQINDTTIKKQNLTEYDKNYSTCYLITGLASDLWNSGNNNTYFNYSSDSCNYCSYSSINSSITISNLSCQINDTTQQNATWLEYDQNYSTCYAITAIASDLWNSGNNLTWYLVYSNATCNYCSFNSINSSWSAWNNLTACLTNDSTIKSQNKTEYDSNYSTCYAITGLLSDKWNNGNNNTWYQNSTDVCNYCSPNPTNTSWGAWSNITACRINDTTLKAQNLTEYDSNYSSCYLVTGLMTDFIANQTYFNYSNDTCNYCSYSVVNSTISLTNITCQTNNTMFQNYTWIEYDQNYSTCYALTHIADDLWNLGNNNSYYYTNSSEYCLYLYFLSVYNHTSQWVSLYWNLNSPVDVEYSLDNTTNWIDITSTDQTAKRGYLLNTLTGTQYYFRGGNSTDYRYTSFKTEDENMSIAMVLGIGMVAGLLLLISWKLDDEHSLLKILMIFTSISLIILIPASFIVDTESIFYRVGIYFFMAFWLYVGGYFVYWLLKRLGIIATGEEEE